MKSHKIYTMPFSGVYPHYVEKAEKNNRSKADVDTIICWLTGFNSDTLHTLIDEEVNFQTFFEKANIHPNATKITGLICGHRVENIDEPLMKKIRYLDKLIDELAKGKSMDKILRS